MNDSLINRPVQSVINCLLDQVYRTEERNRYYMKAVMEYLLNRLKVSFFPE